jgi:hypothetical protein
MSVSQSSVGSKRKKDSLAANIYAHNAPKIFLETVTAKTTTLVFAVTYIAFIVGFTYDILTVYKGFKTSERVLGAKSCSQQNISVSQHPKADFGCSSGASWNGLVTSLENVISVSLAVNQNNISTILNSKNSSKLESFNLQYDLRLWACYLPYGCKNNFASINDYSDSAWHKVIELPSQSVFIPKKIAVDNLRFQVGLLPNTFQNQESIPAHGKVQSYYFEVKFHDNPSGLFTGTNVVAFSVAYSVSVLSHPQFYTASGVFSCVLIFIAFGTLVGFVYAMSIQKRRWLSEQKWICFYLVALILFINPFYCIIIWFQYVPVEAVFAFYVSDLLGQAAFFVVWLLFADSYRRKTSSQLEFYGPKILMGLCIFATSLAVLIYQFPDIDSEGKLNQRSAVQAVQNWSDALKRTFIAVSVTSFVLVGLWAIWWLATLFVTGRALQRLPYMNTRYIQLSFRFFSMQAIMVAVYYVFQVGAVILFLIEYAAAGVTSSTDITGLINTLSRQQTQMFGKIVFLSVYALVMTFLFLPANVLEHSLAASLASTFVITEREMKDTVRERRHVLKEIKQLTGGVVSRFIDAKPEVFCVDIALNLCNISFEAYYDPEGTKTISGYDTKAMELEKHGYRLVDVLYSPEHETFCFIARHLFSKKIVVCFRYVC